MQYQKQSNRSAAAVPDALSKAASRMGFNNTQELKSSVEGWEQCLRNQITSHPRIALGMGLMAGLVLGWWVKR